MSLWSKIFGRPASTRGATKPSESAPRATAAPDAAVTRDVVTRTCDGCGAPVTLSKRTPSLGTVLACSRCGVPVVPLRPEAGGMREREVDWFLGYDCSLGNPNCQSCGKTNFGVVFPDAGYDLPWYHNRKPANPNGFYIDVTCVHCAAGFVVEWDTFPIRKVSCNYCSARVIGGNLLTIPESRRRDFESDYGRPPELPPPIKQGDGEPVWLICGPCNTIASRNRHRNLVAASQAFAARSLDTLPEAVSLRQLITGGFIAADQVRSFERFEVTIPLDDGHPNGPGIRVETPEGKAFVLLADGNITEPDEYVLIANALKAGRAGNASSSGGGGSDALFVELVRIGKASFHYYYPEDQVGATWFWEPGGKGRKHERVIQIGREFDALGGMPLMRAVAERVRTALGAGAVSDLSAHWDRVGDWWH